MATNPYNQSGAVASSGFKTYSKKDVKAGKINPYDQFGADTRDDALKEQKQRQQSENDKAAKQRAADVATQVAQQKAQATQQKQANSQPKKSTASKVVSALGGIGKGAANLGGDLVGSSAEAINKGVIKPYLTSPAAAVGSAAADVTSGKGFDYKKRYKEAQNEASPVRQAANVIDKKLGTNITSGVDYGDKHTKEVLGTTAAVIADIGSGGLLTPVIAPAMLAYYTPKYVGGIPSTIKAIQKEPNVSNKFALGTELVGQGLLLGKGAKDSVDYVRNGPKGSLPKLPTTKEVNVGKTVPNDEARTFFNSPNPDISPETSALLTKALADNKAKFVQELKGGKGVTVDDIQTVPTVYGKLLNIIKSKMDKGQKLTPNEDGIVQQMAKNPGQFVKSKAMVKAQPQLSEPAAPVAPTLPPAVAPAPELAPIDLPAGIAHPDNIEQPPAPPPPAEPVDKGALKPLKPAVVKAKGTGTITTYSGHQGRGSAFSTPDKQFAQQFANEDANGNPVKGVVGTKKLNKTDILDTRNAEDRAKLESVLGQENVSKMIDSSGNGLPAHVDKGEQDALVKAAKQLGFKHIALSETDNQTKYNGSHVISYVDTSKDVTKEVTQEPKPKGTVKPLKKTAAPPATAEKPHITAGKVEAASMKKADVMATLDKKFKSYAEGKADLEAFANHIQQMGGTFGNFNGHYDTSTAKQGMVTVKLRDGREFKVTMADLFKRLNKSKAVPKKVELQKPKSSDRELVTSVAGEYKNPKDFVKDTAEGYYTIEKSLKGGQLISDGEQYGYGVKRTTEHTPFYRDFYAEHKRAPTLTDYVEAVQKELDTGRGQIIEDAEHDIYHMLNKELDVKAFPKTSYSGTSGGGAKGTGRTYRDKMPKTPPEEEAPPEPVTKTSKTSNPIKKFIQETTAHKEVAGTLDDQLHALGGNSVADNIALNHLFKDVKKLEVKPEDWTAIYHYAEDRSAPVTPEQKTLYEETIKPLQDSINTMRTDMGLKPFKNDEFIHRIAQGHGSSLQRYLEGDNKDIRAGNVLKKTSDSMKTRSWMKLVDPKNPSNFHIVNINSPKNKLGKALGERQVTAYTYGKKTPMGALKRKIPTPTHEFFDPVLMNQLEDIAKGLGIKHERTNLPLKQGDRAAGVSYGGMKYIKTKAASPLDVLIHEIGHQVDERFNMQSQFLGNVKDQSTKAAKEEQRTIKQELRDLADKRIGAGGSKSFSKYVRSGEEKMAVMFQAYLHAPEIFKAVAPVTYDKFDAFLRAHPETKPIANMEKSLELGSAKVGDVRHEGEFIDKTGKKWKIINATTKEVEANSDTRYYKQPLVSTAIDYMQTRQALRAAQFLDKWKESPDFLYKEHEDGTTSGIAIKSDAKTIPDGWKTTTAPQFKGYHFEPRTAEVLDDFARTAARGDPLGAFTGMNLFMRNTIFYNPLMHVPNIMWHAVMRRGVSGLSNPIRIARGTTSSVQAINEIVHKGTLYQELLREGAPLMSFNRQALSKMIGKMMDDTIQDNKAVSTIAKLAGYSSKANFIKAWYKVSSGVTWGSHDFFMLQAMIEEMKRGLTPQEAIHEVTAHIPDYRLPTRFLNSRSLKTTLANHNVTMFLPYHYGIFKSYANTVREMGGVAPRGGKQETGFIGRAKTSARGVDKMLMFGVIALLLYPEMDRLAKRLFGESNAVVRRAGPFTFPYAIYQMLEGKRTPQSTATLVLPTPPGTKGVIQLLRNRDDLNRQIWDPGDAFKLPARAAKDIGHFVLGTIAPTQQIQKAQKGQLGIKKFGENLIGVQTPNDIKNLVSKLYSQQLNLGVQSKQQQRVNQQKNEARDQISAGKGDALAKKLVSDGYLSKDKLKEFEKTAKWTPMQRNFDNLNWINKLQVMQGAQQKDWTQLGDMKLIKDQAGKAINNKKTSAANKEAAKTIQHMLDAY